jgi:hypothetical protein
MKLTLTGVCSLNEEDAIDICVIGFVSPVLENIMTVFPLHLEISQELLTQMFV